MIIHVMTQTEGRTPRSQEYQCEGQAGPPGRQRRCRKTHRVRTRYAKDADHITCVEHVNTAPPTPPGLIRHIDLLGAYALLRDRVPTDNEIESVRRAKLTVLAADPEERPR